MGILDDLQKEVRLLDEGANHEGCHHHCDWNKNVVKSMSGDIEPGAYFHVS